MLVFIVSHFSHLVPESVVFQNVWGVRKINTPHSLYVIATYNEYSGRPLLRTLTRACW